MHDEGLLAVRVKTVAIRIGITGGEALTPMILAQLLPLPLLEYICGTPRF
jgi:hypothetical protein